MSGRLEERNKMNIVRSNAYKEVLTARDDAKLKHVETLSLKTIV